MISENVPNFCLATCNPSYVCNRCIFFFMYNVYSIMISDTALEQWGYTTMMSGLVARANRQGITRIMFELTTVGLAKTWKVCAAVALISD